MSQTAPEQFLPAVLGNELETQVRLLERVNFERDEHGNPIERIRQREPVKALDIVPADLYLGFNKIRNGSKAYCGVSLPNNAGEALELAGPECLTPSQLVESIRANELVTENGILELLQGKQANYGGRLVGAIKNHRVIDAYGNTRGCHDNFGYDEDTFKVLYPLLADYLPAYQSTLPTLTGAGLVRANGMYDYAQKISDVDSLTIYSFNSRLYRAESSSNEMIKRIEIAASDANISDWQVMARVGSIAIFLALLADGQGPVLQNWLPEQKSLAILSAAKDYNRMMSKDGYESFYVSVMQRKNVDCYRFTAELFLKRFAERGVHPQYMWIAEQISEFGTDLLKVGRGKEPLSLLTDRADWAIKFAMLQQYRQRQKNKGKDIRLGDDATRRYDFRYDEWQADLTEAGPRVSLGIGAQYKQRGNFRYTADAAAVAALYDTPPPTRSAGIVELMEQNKGLVNAVDWHYVICHTDDTKINRVQYQLLDARIPTVHDVRSLENKTAHGPVFPFVPGQTAVA